MTQQILKYEDRLVITKNNLIGLQQLIGKEPKKMFTHVASFFGIIFTLKELFDSDEFKALSIQIKNEDVMANNVVGELKTLQTIITKTFSEDWIIFQPNSLKVRPYSENIFIRTDKNLNNKNRSVLSLQNKMEEGTSTYDEIETQNLFRKITIFISEKRVCIIHSIEKIENMLHSLD